MDTEPALGAAEPLVDVLHNEAPPSKGKSAGKGKGSPPPPPCKAAGKGPPPGKASPSKAAGKGSLPSSAPTPAAPVVKVLAPVDAGLPDTGTFPKLRHIFWTVIQQVPNDSVWEMSVPPAYFDRVQLEKNFSAVETKAPASPTATPRDRSQDPGARRYLRVLDEQTGRKLGIQFSRLPPPDRLVTILQTLDGFPDDLPPEGLLALHAAATEQREAIEQIRQLPIAETEIDRLEVPERYLWSLGSIPFYRERLACGALLVGPAQELEGFVAAAGAVRSCCLALRETALVHKIIFTSLAVGNHMNSGTSRGEARALVLPDALQKLEDVRNTHCSDDSVPLPAAQNLSLLDFVAQALVNEGDAGQMIVADDASNLRCELLHEEIDRLVKCLRDAQSVSLGAVETCCQQVVAEARRVRKTLEILPQMDALNSISNKVSDIEREASATLETLQQAKTQLSKTQTWLSAKNNIKSDDWFAGWFSFFEHFSQALSKYQARLLKSLPVQIIDDGSGSGSAQTRGFDKRCPSLSRSQSAGVSPRRPRRCETLHVPTQTSSGSFDASTPQPTQATCPLAENAPSQVDDTAKTCDRGLRRWKTLPVPTRKARKAGVALDSSSDRGEATTPTPESPLTSEGDLLESTCESKQRASLERPGPRRDQILKLHLDVAIATGSKRSDPPSSSFERSEADEGALAHQKSALAQWHHPFNTPDVSARVPCMNTSEIKEDQMVGDVSISSYMETTPGRVESSGPREPQHTQKPHNDAALECPSSVARAANLTMQDAGAEISAVRHSQSTRPAFARKEEQDRSRVTVRPAQARSDKICGRGDARISTPRWMLPLEELSLDEEKLISSDNACAATSKSLPAKKPTVDERKPDSVLQQSTAAPSATPRDLGHIRQSASAADVQVSPSPFKWSAPAPEPLKWFAPSAETEESQSPQMRRGRISNKDNELSTLALWTVERRRQVSPVHRAPKVTAGDLLEEKITYPTRKLDRQQIATTVDEPTLQEMRAKLKPTRSNRIVPDREQPAIDMLASTATLRSKSPLKKHLKGTLLPTVT